MMISTRNFAELREGNNIELLTKLSMKRRGTLEELYWQANQYHTWDLIVYII
jgi:hypothetical protein